MCPQEVPLEQAQEDIAHHAHAHAHAEPERWIMGVALTAAILAALAAITALIGDDNAEEAMIGQMQSSDQWNFYQAKSLKEMLISTRIEILQAQGQQPKPEDLEKMARYREEQQAIKREAEAKEHQSEIRFQRHSTLARGVTMFQVAIAVSAISVLTRRKAFWGVAGVFGALGLVFLVWGLAFV